MKRNAKMRPWTALAHLITAGSCMLIHACPQKTELCCKRLWAASDFQGAGVYPFDPACRIRKFPHNLGQRFGLDLCVFTDSAVPGAQEVAVIDKFFLLKRPFSEMNYIILDPLKIILRACRLPFPLICKCRQPIQPANLFAK